MKRRLPPEIEQAARIAAASIAAQKKRGPPPTDAQRIAEQLAPKSAAGPSHRPRFVKGRPRLARGTMNKTEAAYAAALELRLRAGEIISYRFEGVKLRLGEGAWYTADFFVQASDDVLELHEIKGFMREAAAVRIKVAADVYPFRFFLVRAIPRRDGGGWDVQAVGA